MYATPTFVHVRWLRHFSADVAAATDATQISLQEQADVTHSVHEFAGAVIDQPMLLPPLRLRQVPAPEPSIINCCQGLQPEKQG